MTAETVSPIGGAVVGGTSPVLFTPASTAQVASDLVIEWDFDNDGDFDQTVENITGYVMSAETMTGRDFPSPLNPAVPGQLSLSLDNRDDRFSYFNATSPLATDPYSLRTGRKIRVRTAEAVANDPVLLARDRFDRPDSDVLGTTETGQTWTAQQGTFAIAGGVASTVEPFETRVLATIDVGATDHYVQATLRQVKPDLSRYAGLIVRWTDINNYSLVRVWTNIGGPQVEIVDVDAGVSTTHVSYPLTPWEGVTLGGGVEGQTITAYVGGAPVVSHTLTGPINGTACGIFGYYAQDRGRSPEIDDFHVWDHVASEVDGILWTGEVTEVKPAVTPGPFKVATVTAEGVLTRAAGAEIASPRLPYAGAPTGPVVGDVLSRAGLLHPPAPLDVGAVTTGAIGIEDGPALGMARLAEETERGFVHETNEGQVGYQDSEARINASSLAWFSDTPGVGQFGYSAIEPLDQRADIINRVTAGVAADPPSGITHDFATGTSHVDITLPTVNQGDLLVIFIASSVRSNTVQWNVPLWWVDHRDNGDSHGMRVYSHICNGTEGGTTVRFYTNSAAASGIWIATWFRIENWFGSYNDGIAMSELASGETANPLVHGWGRYPTLFIIAQAGITASVATSFDATPTPPDGYTDTAALNFGSGVVAFDTGIATAYKVDVTESEQPTAFQAFDGFDITETAIFAVRGYNGPFTKATLANPNTIGGDGRFVTVEDVDSQDTHNAIRSHPAPSYLFASEVDAKAYGQAYVNAFGDDRTLVSIRFFATSNAGLRAQAVRRRVGDKVTLTASGDTGLGIEGDFFVEGIGHRWSKGAKVWECTWQLSPA